MVIPFTEKAVREHERPAAGEPPIVCGFTGHPNKKVTFYANKISLGYDKSHDGSRYKGTFGSSPTLPLSIYDKLHREKMLEIETGQVLRGQDLTVNELIDDHVLPEMLGRNRDIKGFKRRLTRIRKQFGKRKVRSLTHYEINKFLNEIAKECKGSTVNRYHSAMSRIFATAVRLGICSENPCKNILRRPESPARQRVLSDAEINHFIDKAVELDSFQALSLLVALFSGWRIGNVISITRDMLDPEFTVITFPETKNGNRYSVQLNGPTRQVLLKCAERSWNQFLFPSAIKDGHHIAYPRETYQIIREYMKEQTGIDKHWTIHDLRRTHSSRQLKLTGDIRLVQQTLFHSSTAVTERYCYHEDARLAEASEDTAQSLLGSHSESFMQQEAPDAA
ncbi:tyrosine-type recombinase/integrase [Neptuniibacter sp. QD29_5]|uniref:tyrosine-type recombinase/integrase n=1 Tax=Neptuniibacter sp. QD29_5 TaxID=3398207 RepID=UPI0039F4DB2F